MSILRRIVGISRSFNFLQPVANNQIDINKSFHLLVRPHQAVDLALNILKPVVNVNVIPTCGFKVKGRLRKRCKDCFFVVRDEKLHVICKAHPRHKQVQMKAAERNTWILSHATQGKIRPW